MICCVLSYNVFPLSQHSPSVKDCVSTISRVSLSGACTFAVLDSVWIVVVVMILWITYSRCTNDRNGLIRSATAPPPFRPAGLAPWLPRPLFDCCPTQGLSFAGISSIRPIICDGTTMVNIPVGVSFNSSARRQRIPCAFSFWNATTTGVLFYRNKRSCRLHRRVGSGSPQSLCSHTRVPPLKKTPSACYPVVTRRLTVVWCWLLRLQPATIPILSVVVLLLQVRASIDGTAPARRTVVGYNRVVLG